MLDRRLRTGVERGLAPLGRAFGRIGITPDALTVLGVVFAAGTAVAVATGHVVWGCIGIILSGLGDLLDGNLARTYGRNGARGAFFDSVTDRVSDALVLGGIAWYVGAKHPHQAVLALAVAALSMLISYERAKAEGLGFEAKGGLMERAERYVLLAVGMAFDILVPILWIMLVLTAFTAVQRFVRVWRQAERPPPLPRVRRDRRTRTAVAGPATPRLRTWFEARATRIDGARRTHPARRRTRP